ncbi:hypothetical protein [Arthrobacter sp. MMS18-M83]|uniref:hypothetical protein n=1 Tax=Arthrobacter sp. MMS18-M83 TaxID=2996261 RepID=UPI00227C0BEB|nr:hypothetical protein [Arthrobacter sp. MMS18-M83]WAH95434.1 hypothetical protein OW521_13315 [Arthrobacter sp. MMS18-M83]
MSQDQSPADLLSAADPALTITDEELEHSRQRSLSFVNSEVTHIAVGGSVHDFHRSPAKRHWGRLVAAGLAAATVAACLLAALSLVTGPFNMAAAPTVTGATVTVPTPVTAAPAPVPNPSPTSVSAEPSPSAGTGPSPRPASTVNPEDYRTNFGTGYYFTSPSGNLLCGIRPDFLNAVGCEANSVVANLPRCDDPRGNAPMISLTSAGAVDATCTNQGVFVVPGAKVLQYGQEIHVGTFSCQSQESGITCREAHTGNAFLASRQEFARIP